MFRICAGLLAILAVLGCAGQAPLPPKAVLLNETGAAALAAGDLVTADARLSLALEYSPHFVEALVNLGLVEVARTDGNMVPAMLDAARAEATLGEICGVLKDEWGIYREPARF